MSQQLSIKTLEIREALLAKLIERLEEPSLLKVHASDFHNAVDSLGLKFGTKDVDDIMVLCRISETGYVNFASLQAHTLSSRTLNSTLPRTPTKPHIKPSSSSGATFIQPSRYQQSKENELQNNADVQGKNIRLHESKIRECYDLFDAGYINCEEFKSNLVELGIEITTDCAALLRREAASDVELSRILRSLTVMDFGGPPSEKKQNKNSDAHSTSSTMAGARASTSGEFGRGKRTDPARSNSVLSTTGIIAEKALMTTHNTGNRKIIFLTSSDGVKSTLNQNQGNTMVTTSQNSNLKGIGESTSSQTSFNCEQKMLRQQIFSLVRKMDDGEITVRAFKESLYTMGFEIPSDVLQLCKNFDSSGKANFKAFARAFERYFAQRNVDSFTSDANLEQIKHQFRDALKQRGVSSIAGLAKVFHQMDADHSKNLSLGEFKKGVKAYGLNSLSDNDLRLLFNSFDHNGDGSLSYSEFLIAIRGEMIASRLSLVRQAFSKMDSTGTGVIPTERLTSIYNPSMHPDVKNHLISEKEAVLQLIDAIDVGEEHDRITITEFMEYYKNISTMMSNDNEFTIMIKTAWDLQALPPPPPAYVHAKDGTLTSKPVAGQDHGDILNWNQQPSSLESRVANRKVRRNFVNDHSQSHNNNNTYEDVVGNGDGGSEIDDHMKSLGRKARQPNSAGKGLRDQSTNILEWNTHVSSPEEKERPRIKQGKDKEDDFVWFAGHKKKTGENNLHYGRPAPFGVDEEATAYKVIAQQRADVAGGRATAASPAKGTGKRQVKSLAEMMGMGGQ